MEGIRPTQITQDQRVPDADLEETSHIGLDPLSKKNLDMAIGVAHIIFPDTIASEEDAQIAYPVSLEPEKYREQLNAAGYRKINYWLATDKTKASNAVGITGLYEKVDEPQDIGWIGWYGVLPQERGKGYGKDILDATIAEAKARGYNTLRLWTTTSEGEAMAQKLYEAYGFKIVKEEEIPGTDIKRLYREKDLRNLA